MAATPPYLAGNYAPVTDELTAQELAVTGSVPRELTGWYLRNGPNPRDAASGHWFAGDGMVHGVRLENGRATSYRNRWVRTRSFTGEVTAFDADGHRDLTAGVANTHVVRHAGRTLALVESSFPYELTCDLDTAGPFDFDGRLRTPMTAHPKTCTCAATRRCGAAGRAGGCPGCCGGGPSTWRPVRWPRSRWTTGTASSRGSTTGWPGRTPATATSRRRTRPVVSR